MQLGRWWHIFQNRRHRRIYTFCGDGVKRDSTRGFLGIEFMAPIRHVRKKLHLLECKILKSRDLVSLIQLIGYGTT